MPEHSDFDPQTNKWFCGYWMTIEEWEDVHDYAPLNTTRVVSEEPQEEDEGE